MTVEITTKEVDSIFPYQMLWFLISSPAQYEKLGKGLGQVRDGAVGHRPLQARQVRPRERAELVKNADYWDKKRLAKVDRIS